MTLGGGQQNTYTSIPIDSIIEVYYILLLLGTT